MKYYAVYETGYYELVYYGQAAIFTLTKIFLIDSLKRNSVLCIYSFLWKIDRIIFLIEQKLTITWTTCKNNVLSVV